MDFENGKIQVFFGPQAYQAKDDLEKEIVDFINDTKESLDVAVQELENPKIAEAIDAVSRRTRDSRPNRRIPVRVVVESSYLRESKPIPPNDPPKLGEFGVNREQMRLLLRGAVHYKLDFNASTFHNKFIIRDYNKPNAALLTGSTNFTPTGTGSNLNNLVIFRDSAVIKAYREEFLEINRGVFGRHSPRGHKAKEAMVGNTRVFPLFAPDHNPELIIVNAVLKAEKSIHLAMFTFSGSSTIDDAMLSALRNGVTVKGVLDRMQSGHKYSPHPKLIAAKAELRRHRVRRLRGFRRGGKLHHKVMVIDRQVVVTGSFNYTGKANQFNDESVFFIHNPDIAEFFIAEIERIYDNLADEFA